MMMREIFLKLKAHGVIFEMKASQVNLKLPKDLDTEIKQLLIDNKDELKAYLETLFVYSKAEQNTISKR